ncbi:uncharacterized protein VP01_1837g1 [Puccinia sorghi]|uniref:AGC protein kinase n=1 Tax=Puccinia sorghi TaxID=27349 RepID=A0A0L6VDT5_9BASI|nr:uncharacterized protein VP01_1837g1 [Puccinia sorghi]
MNHNTTTPSWPEPSQQPSQQLIITLIGATELKLPQPHLGPYAVLQFDHTESITEQAHSPSPHPTKSLRSKWRPTRLHHSTTAIPQLTNNNTSSASTHHSPHSTVCHLTPTSTSSALDQPTWNHVAIFDIFKPRSSLFISIYYNQDSLHPNQDKTDMLLGYTIIDLATLLADHTISQEINQQQDASNSHLILDRPIDLWDQSGNDKTGSISIKIEIKQINNLNQQYPLEEINEEKVEKTELPTMKKISIDDFEIIKLIGEGSYGQVYRVRKKDTRRLYAMKTLDKRQILLQADGDRDSNQMDRGETPKIKLERVLTERKILEQTRGCEFLVGLKFSFQTPHNLNLVMDLKSGGELMSYMQRFGGRFEESWVIFYAAEILSGLKFLHSINIAYRDLKVESPRELLARRDWTRRALRFRLEQTGHGFGVDHQDFLRDDRVHCPRSSSLLENGYTRLVDFWALGVLIFEVTDVTVMLSQMSAGWTPFFSENRAVRYTLILESDIRTKFPKRGISEVTKAIILRVCTRLLLEREPSRRLGSKGIQEIEEHDFFKGLDWEALRSKRLTPPFKPRVESDASLSYASDPIYSYGGRASNSLRVKGAVERHSAEEHVHPSALSAQITRTLHARPNTTYHQSGQTYQYQQQHSRRSSVENKTTGVPLLGPNQQYPKNTSHLVDSLAEHPPANNQLDHLALTQRQSEEDLQHLSGPQIHNHNHHHSSNSNHPLHLNGHNFFKGFTFSRDDSLIN